MNPSIVPAASEANFSTALAPAAAPESKMELAYRIAACTADNLGAAMMPHLDKVAAGTADAQTALALGIGGCVATNNFLAVQPLVEQVNRVLTERLNAIEPGSPEWNELRPAQALWFGIYKAKQGKEETMGMVKDGLEAAFLKYPSVSTDELPNYLAERMKTIKTGSDTEKITALFEVGALYYSHNKTSNETYQNTMAQVLEHVTRTNLSPEVTNAAIISLIHCEAALTPTQTRYIASGGNRNLPEYMSAWHIAISDNIHETVKAGGIASYVPDVVHAMYDVKIAGESADPKADRLVQLRADVAKGRYGGTEGHEYIRRLGALGDADDIAALSKIVREPAFNSDISRPLAIRAIQEIGHRGYPAESIKALTDILTNEDLRLTNRRYDGATGLRAIEALASFGTAAQGALPLIVAFNARPAQGFTYRETEAGRRRARFGGNAEQPFPLSTADAEALPVIMQSRQAITQHIATIQGLRH